MDRVDRERMRLQWEAEQDPDWIATQRGCLIIIFWLAIVAAAVAVYFAVR
jgi:predicted hotdog family 3-hydroxylacyl-ACP dehydratase